MTPKALWTAIWLGSTICACGDNTQSNGKEYSCDEICQRLIDCEKQSDPEACQSFCSESKSKLREAGFIGVGRCIMQEACQDVSVDGCNQQVAESLPDSITDNALATICTRLVQCSLSGLTNQQCIQMVVALPEYTLLRLFNDSVIDCMANCINNKDCSSLRGNLEAPVGACAIECDLFDDW